jgi:glycosyltransferase involved in cell wall biosynthesis
MATQMDNMTAPASAVALSGISQPPALASESNGLSIVIPVYNAAASLQELHDALTFELTRLAVPYEIILVEDNGKDNSWSIITKLAAQNQCVRGIRLNRNFGQHNALLCGIRAARYPIVVTMDDDLQNPPSEIGKIVEKLNSGYDIVYGTPAKEQHGILRDSASRLTKLALSATLGAAMAPHVSAFRAFRTSLRDSFDTYSGPSVSIDILLSWASSSYASVAVAHVPRKYGTSNYTFWKLANHALNLVTGFGTAPLKVASLLGFAFMLFGFALLLYIVVNWLVRGAAVPGFAFLGSAIAVFSGVQLFTLGIFGEYLGRIYTRTMNQPSYFIGAQTGSDPERKP